MSFINGANQPVLHSYGRVDAIMHSFFKYSSFLGTHDSKNNRIFLQSQNIGGIRYPDTIIRYPHTSDWGIGLTVFDYSGNVIDGQDYNTISQSNAPGPLCLKDSNLYLMQCLTTDATFGDIHLSVNERMASIAKYVDPAFMTPYVSPVVNVIQPAGEAPLSVCPNPAHNVLHVTPLKEPLLGASAISVYGRKEPLGVRGQSIDVSRLTPGIYLLEINTTQQQYHLKFIKL